MKRGFFFFLPEFTLEYFGTDKVDEAWNFSFDFATPVSCLRVLLFFADIRGDVWVV